MSADFGIVSIKMAISLIIILGLIISLFFVLKRLRLNPLSNSKIPVMRLLGTLSLAPKRSIALVEVCDQWLIVGIGTENVTLISKIDPPPDTAVSNSGMPADGKKFHSFLENLGIWRRTPESADTGRNAKA